MTDIDDDAESRADELNTALVDCTDMTLDRKSMKRINQNDATRLDSTRRTKGRERERERERQLYEMSIAP